MLLVCFYQTSGPYAAGCRRYGAYGCGPSWYLRFEADTSGRYRTLRS